MKRTANFFMAAILITCIMPITSVFSAEGDFGYNTIFNESFENYNTNVEWTNSLDSDGVTVLNSAVGGEMGAWKLGNPKNSGNSAMVVNGNQVGRNGNVLKIFAGENNTLFLVRRNSNKETGIDFHAAGDHYGKKLVYKADVFLPDNFSSSGEGRGLSFNNLNSTLNSEGPFSRISSAGSLVISKGPWASRTNTYENRAFARVEPVLKGSWQTVTAVVDQTAAAIKERPDTVRWYVDGVLQKGCYVYGGGIKTDGSDGNPVEYAYDFHSERFDRTAASPENISFGTFYGVVMASLGSSGVNPLIYIDNLEAFSVNNFEFLSADGFSADFTAKDTAVFKFTTPLDKETILSAFSVTNTFGGTIPGAIKDVSLTDNGCTANLSFDFSKLEGETEYKLNISPEFHDSYYQGIFKEIQIYSFKTAKKLNVTVTPSSVSGYDKGKEQEIKIAFSSPVTVNGNTADAFSVKDAANNEISGLTAVINDNKDEITLQLNGLLLGDGTHTIEAKEGAIKDSNGIEAIVYIKVSTLDFTAVITPNAVKDFYEGKNVTVSVALSLPTVLTQSEIADGFMVTDSVDNIRNGLAVQLSADRKIITLNLAGLELGKGIHLIKTTDSFKDNRGRKLTSSISVEMLPFTASYEAGITNYEPNTARDITITLSHPLDEASAANITKSFVVKNKYGSNVSGLLTALSSDKKIITLSLGGLDIEGGSYNILSAANSLKNILGDLLSQISITLETKKTVDPTITEDIGVAAGSGSLLSQPYTYKTIINENFEAYETEKDWITNGAPSLWEIRKSNSENFADAYVKVTDDPSGSSGKVLKIASGNLNSSGQHISDGTRYNTVFRKTDDGLGFTASSPDEVISIKTRVYFEKSSFSGLPTGNIDAAGAGRDSAYLIAPAVTSTLSIPSDMKSTLRRNDTSPIYYSWVRPIGAASDGQLTSILEAGKWHDIELRFTQVPIGAGYANGYYLYINGVQIKMSTGDAYPGAFSPIYGIASRIITANVAGNNPVIYYDNWSVTKIYKLKTHVSIPKTENSADSSIDLTFTNSLTPESISYAEKSVRILDENNNIIETEVTKNGNESITIKPKYGFKYQSKYIAFIDKEITEAGKTIKLIDVQGNEFPGLSYSFSTKKAEGITIDKENGSLSYDAAFLEEETEFEYNMKLSGGANKDLIAGIAAYGRSGELLGIAYKTIPQGGTGVILELSSDRGTKYIKLYLWEKSADGFFGKLLQIPDELSSR